MDTYIIRQGDVLLRRVSALPDSKRLREVNRDEHSRLVLEYGEVTGHAHAVLSAGAKLYSVVDEAERVVGQYLTVKEPTDLLHEEHGTITLPPGVYERWYQMEYDGEEERRVLD